MANQNNQFIEKLAKIEREFGLPSHILDMMSEVESGRRFNALGDGDLSIGGFQIKTGLKGGAQDLRDNFENFRDFVPGEDHERDARAAATFLRFNDTQYLTGSNDNIALMLAAYNAGGGRVNKDGLNAAGGAPYDYVAKYVVSLARHGHRDTLNELLSDVAEIESSDVNLGRFYATAYFKMASKDEIKVVQEMLQGAGLYSGKIDGVVGQGTLAALKRCDEIEGFESSIKSLLDGEIEAAIAGVKPGVAPVVSKAAAVATPVINSPDQNPDIQRPEQWEIGRKTTKPGAEAGLNDYERQLIASVAAAEERAGGDAANRHWEIRKDPEVVKAIQQALNLQQTGVNNYRTVLAWREVNPGDDYITSQELERLLSRQNIDIKER